MPPIVPGQHFDTLQDFKNALREWAVEKNFTPHILDSDCHRVRAGCRSAPNCPFKIRCNFSEKRNDASVTTIFGVHTCASSRGASTGGSRVSQDIKRAETCKLKFLLEKVPALLNVGQGTTTKEIMDAVKRRYGQDIALRQAQKVKAMLAPKARNPCRFCGGPWHGRGKKCTMEPRRESSGDGEGPRTREEEDMQVDGDKDVSPQLVDDEHPLPTPAPAILPITLMPQCNRSLDPRLKSTVGAVPRTITLTPRAVLQQQGQNITTNSTFMSNSQVQRTPQETRLEAARLMQNAARLMQEAARMNAEAARLTASVANV